MKFYWFILFSITLLFAPLGHDLSRYGIPTSLLWNDSSWILLIFFFFWMGTFFVRTFSSHMRTNNRMSVPLLLYFGLLLLVTVITPRFRSFVDVTPFLLLPLVIWFVSFIRNKRQILLASLVLVGILVLQAQWGILQFVFQHDTGFYLLGEPHISASTPGVAKFSLAGTKLIRSYGPYLHTNALSATMVVGLVLLSSIKATLAAAKLDRHIEVRAYLVSMLACLLLALLFTFSRAAYLSTALLVGCLLYRQKTFSWRTNKSYVFMCIALLCVSTIFIHARLSDSEDQAVTERARGYQWYGQIVSIPMLWQGIGFGNYENSLVSHLGQQHTIFHSWEIAPIHNVLLLAGIETGFIPTIVGLGILGYAVHRMWQPRWQTVAFLLVPLLPLVLLDHYLISLPSTLAVVATAYSLALVLKS